MARVVVIIEGLPGEDVVECYVSDDRDVRCGERLDIAGLIERFDELRARGRGHVEVQASAESPVLTLGFTESAAVVHLMTGEDAISLLAGRLTSAWTPKAGVDCKTTPTTANLGGPAPYWHDWTFDKVGNRLTETAHTSAGDTKRTYTVPTGGKNVVRPHAATAVLTEAPGQQAVTNAYAYDNAGNTTCRPTGTATNTCPPGNASQNLSWDPEGRLTSISGDAPSAGSNIYDADGNRLLRRDATGTTLYLPGIDIRWNGTTRNTTRYYTFPGRLIASRTATALTWLITDHQGTQHTTISNSGTQTVTRRYQTPYGNPRGSQIPWANPKGLRRRRQRPHRTHPPRRPRIQPRTRPIHQRRPTARPHQPPAMARLQLRQQQPHHPQ